MILSIVNINMYGYAGVELDITRIIHEKNHRDRVAHKLIRCLIVSCEILVS